MTRRTGDREDATMAETPEEMVREIDAEPRLRARRIPPGGEKPHVVARAWEVITLRHEGHSYAEIARRVGLSGQRVKELSHWQAR